MIGLRVFKCVCFVEMSCLGSLSLIFREFGVYLKGEKKKREGKRSGFYNYGCIVIYLYYLIVFFLLI